MNTFPTLFYIQRYKGNAIPIPPSPILLYNLVPLSAKHNYRRIINSQLLRIKHQNLQMFGLKLNKYEYFSPTSSCGCVNVTQINMGENFNYVM